MNLWEVSWLAVVAVAFAASVGLTVWANRTGNDSVRIVAVLLALFSALAAFVYVILFPK